MQSTYIAPNLTMCGYPVQSNPCTPSLKAPPFKSKSPASGAMTSWLRSLIGLWPTRLTVMWFQVRKALEKSDGRPKAKGNALVPG